MAFVENIAYLANMAYSAYSANMAHLANMAHSAYSMNKAYSAHLNEAYFAYLEKNAYLEQIQISKIWLIRHIQKI